MKVIVALILLGQTLLPQTRPDESAIVNVPGTSPWTDTGIDVKSGDRIEMRAWGLITFEAASSPNSAGPAGSGPSTGGCEFVVTDPHVAAHSLVANVAEAMTFDGRGFLVGPSWKGTAPIAGTTAPTGRLFVGFNDRAMICDRSGYDSWVFRNRNSGAFTTSITITRRH
jgi:hypothetical protein